MEIDRRVEDGILVLSLSGHFGAGMAGTFTEEISTAIESGHTCVLIDLHGLEFLDSRGIEAIVRNEKRILLHGGAMAASRPTAFVKKLVSRLGLYQALPLFDDLPEGIAWLRDKC
jgi:anti-anti-sigma factor